MAMNMKEVASLRGNDKLYEENLAKIDFSGVGGKAPEVLFDEPKYLCAGCDTPHSPDVVCKLCGHTNTTVDFKSLPLVPKVVDHTIERDYEWVKWNGEYEKRLYFIRTSKGAVYECYPNAGMMICINNLPHETPISFTVEDEIEVAIWNQ